LTVAVAGFPSLRLAPGRRVHSVEPKGSIMALVTPQEAQVVHGVTVSQDDVDMAQIDVDIVAEIDLDDVDQVGRLIDRDLKMIRYAISYQAAWRKAQISLTERTDITEIAGAASDGGVKLRDELSLILAPMTRACLSRVSWKKRRTMPDRTRGAGSGSYVAPPGVVVSTDPCDNPGQASNFERDAGPWAEVITS
jgi:hypothetical protein